MERGKGETDGEERRGWSETGREKEGGEGRAVQRRKL